MAILVVALLGGAALGMATGGDPANAARRAVRNTWLLVVGVILQATALVFGETSVAVLLASFACLLAFALRNLGLVGMPLVFVGLALNALVITANGAMPVRPQALVVAGAIDATDVGDGDIEGLALGPKRRLERPSDRLAVLGDTLPVAPLRTVLSFGDLVLAAGLADVAFRLLRPRGAAVPAHCQP